jgi:tetratricopeptide (TPR) repeat protein
MMGSSKLIVLACLATLFSALTGFAQNAGNSQTADPLTTYNTAITEKNWAGAVAAAQQLVSQTPSSVNLRLLATAQLDARSAADALAAFERALAAAKTEQPTGDVEAMTKWKDGLADIYVGEGNALLLLKRMPEAMAAYTNGAQYSSKPAVAYFNVCAVAYNNGDMDNAEAACRKSLQVDPTMANSWFVLGSVLFGNTPVDAKGNMTFSVETKQALAKYLELAPNGPHASDVKAMQDMIPK